MKLDPISLSKWSGLRNALQDKNILVIDDEESIRKLMMDILSITGAKVTTATEGEAGIVALESGRYDLILLDIMMPNVNGLEICRRIREFSSIPIIIVSALERSDVIVAGLESGADDYVAKPFEIEVLIARVRALLRRKELDTEKWLVYYNDGYLSFDLEKKQVAVLGQSIPLNKIEFNLLSYLAKHAGRVRTYAQIMSTVWGEKFAEYPEFAHGYVNQLRKKLERDPQNPAYLVTAQKIGYRFEPDPSKMLVFQ